LIVESAIHLQLNYCEEVLFVKSCCIYIHIQQFLWEPLTMFYGTLVGELWFLISHKTSALHEILCVCICVYVHGHG
jgi:hypothetical protein